MVHKYLVDKEEVKTGVQETLQTQDRVLVVLQNSQAVVEAQARLVANHAVGEAGDKPAQLKYRIVRKGK